MITVKAAMVNSLPDLGPVLRLLADNLHILPATGGAVEDLQRPDADEQDDSLINEEVREITEFAEDPPPQRGDLYCSTPPLHRRERHLYHFFIDGSLRTYYLATGIERNRTFPIELAQIGAACIHRKDDGILTTHAHRNRILLLAPKGGDGISDSLWGELVKLNAPDGSFEVIDISEDNTHTRKQVDPRTRAGGISRNRMHKLEVKIIKRTDDFRSDESWVILDGAVKLDAFIETDHLIGVAKSFDKKPQFHFGRGRTPSIDVTGLLAGLPFAHRTRAFRSHGGKVAFWYVRLWEQKDLDYPLMGVVKVELPRPNLDPVPSDLVDLLSRALVGERSVTPYGKDKRWHTHLYPIFCAEQTIKSRFFSEEVLMGMIRWPRPSSSAA